MINPKLKQPAPDANPDPFNRPPPGWSLTQPKGKWAWESPPQHTDVDETVDMIIDKLEDPKVSDRYVKLMIAGVSVEEIVDSIALAGFTEGQFNPDVAELVKAPLAIYLMKLADDYDIPFKLFGNPEEMAQEEEGLVRQQSSVLCVSVTQTCTTTLLTTPHLKLNAQWLDTVSLKQVS